MNWPKTPRRNRVRVTITEKIDGTNGTVVITDGGVECYSRNRKLTPENDNHGFCSFMLDHSDELWSHLGTGRFVGEWAGPGIQKNPLGLEQRTFFVFEPMSLVLKWHVDGDVPPCPWLRAVPVWYSAPDLDLYELADVENGLQEDLQSGKLPTTIRVSDQPEGYVVCINGMRYKWTPRAGKAGK